MDNLPTTRSIEKSINNAASIITKSYLDELEKYEIQKPSEEDIDIDSGKIGAFYKLTKLVWNYDESFLDKLTTIVDVVYSIKSSLVTLITSDGNNIDYYIGILSKRYRMDDEKHQNRRDADKKAFFGALSGNMIGADIIKIDSNELKNVEDNSFGKSGDKSIAAVSGIVSLRNDLSSSEAYVQGLENLVDSLRGMKYSILTIADPVSTDEVEVIKHGYEILHTQLATFRSSSMTLSENEAHTLSKAQTLGITEGISKGISMTQSKTTSKGKFNSISFNSGISIGVPTIGGVNVGMGIAGGTNSSVANSTGSTKTHTETFQKQKSITESIGSTNTVGKSLQINYENRTVVALLDKINKYLERLDNCESFGAFDCASYCFADTRDNALAVASNYNAILRGQDSSIQASHINIWDKEDDKKTIYNYLSKYVHPKFVKTPYSDLEERIIVSPTSIISGNELAIQVGFPKKSISGITVIPMAAFGRNMPQIPEKQRIQIGNLYHMGRVDAGTSKVNLDIESLTMHTFITGSTGSGKSTMIYNILDKLIKKRKKFLVIEPAKGEYKNRYGNLDGVSVYGSNPAKTPLLKINPFSFPEDIHVLEHIDRLIEIFNVCWPMYAAMPAVLKEAVERAYEVAGWKLDTSCNKFRTKSGKVLYPTFSDVLEQINMVMEESEYSSDSKGDYKGALCTRIQSLTTGIYGQIFVSDEIQDCKLFDENVIIDLSRIGSTESKSLIMGLLVMKLQEYRMSQDNGMNQSLQHVTVLEEAHNILKRTSSDFSQESANLTGKSVELLANSIAEMRTYGEGFIIADQSPGLMDMSVIRNTNTKIILRLPDQNDRELVGKAASLSDEQIREISKFPTFVAAVYQNNWLEPVLCKIDEQSFDRVQVYKYENAKSEKKSDWKKYISFLIMPIHKRNALDAGYVSSLIQKIYTLNVSARTKASFIKYIYANNKEEIQRYRSLALYGFFNSERAFSLSRRSENDFKLWYDHMCETLEPSIKQLEEQDKQKIIANLAMENTVVKETEEAVLLLERIMRSF